MRSCICCKYYDTPTCNDPCHKCVYVEGSPNWEPDDHIAGLIEATERKAFDAGWVSRNCDLGRETFDEWKKGGS